MAYSGPAPFAVLEADLAMSGDEEEWPPLSGDGGNRRSPAPVVPAPPAPPPDCELQAAPSSSSKRTMDEANTSGDDLTPASKSSRPGSRASPPAVDDSAAVGDCPPLLPPTMSSSPPARPPHPSTQATLSRIPPFAPRTDYVKLEFVDSPTMAVKLRWLTEVNRHFCLDRDLAEVKMSAVTSRFVYVSRRRQDIVRSVVAGEFMALKLRVEDSPERPRKFPSYLVTRYPVGVDPSLSRELTGVYSARRFHHNGQPINRIVITWSREEPPPSSVAFSFLPCLPLCELRLMADDRPMCFRCWEVGHISRYCSAAEKCAWCSGPHDSRSCPHRGPPRPSTEVPATPPPPPPLSVTSNWQCPRCQERGVSAWHGCPRRRSSPSSPPPPPPPPRRPVLPPPPSGSPDPSLPPRVLALESAIKKLQAQTTSLESRLDAMEATINNLAVSQASVEASVATLTEAQHAVVKQLSTLTQRFEAWAQRAAVLPGPSTPSSVVGTTASSSPGSRHRVSRKIR